MSDTAPHSYSLASYRSEKSRYFYLGAFLMVAGLVCAGLSLRVTEVVAASMLSNTCLVALSIGLYLVTPRRYFVCSKCGNEIVGQPLLCRTCRCKCLPEPAPNTAPAKYTWLTFVMLAVSLLALAFGIISLLFVLKRWTSPLIPFLLPLIPSHQ